MKNIQIDNFGKDHWSMLAYAECMAVDCKGQIDCRRIRMKNNKYWKPEYTTRLKNNAITENHDDVDCLNDLEYNGLIEVISYANLIIKMTEKGNKISANLRNFKSSGGKFVNFGDSEYYLKLK